MKKNRKCKGDKKSLCRARGASWYKTESTRLLPPGAVGWLRGVSRRRITQAPRAAFRVYGPAKAYRVYGTISSGLRRDSSVSEVIVEEKRRSHVQRSRARSTRSLSILRIRVRNVDRVPPTPAPRSLSRSGTKVREWPRHPTRSCSVSNQRVGKAGTKGDTKIQPSGGISMQVAGFWSSRGQIKMEILLEWKASRPSRAGGRRARSAPPGKLEFEEISNGSDTCGRKAGDRAGSGVSDKRRSTVFSCRNRLKRNVNASEKRGARTPWNAAVSSNLRLCSMSNVVFASRHIKETKTSETWFAFRR